VNRGMLGGGARGVRIAFSRTEYRVKSDAKFSSSSSSSAISSGMMRVVDKMYDGSGAITCRRGDGSLDGIRLVAGEGFLERVRDFRSSSRVFMDGRLELEDARDVERPLRSVSW